MQNQVVSATRAEDEWHGKVVMVTGAGQGLGGAVALDLARRGATLALLGKSQKKLEQTYDAVMAAGAPEPLMLPLDFSQADAGTFSQVALIVKRECSGVDALIHCAVSLGSIGPMEHQKPEDWTRAFSVNTFASVQLTRACSPIFQRGAQIAFVLDHHVFAPGPYWGGYVASKHALWGFAQTLSYEWAERGVGVHAIVPGPIDSPLRRQTHPGESPSQRLPIDTAATRLVDRLSNKTQASTIRFDLQ